MKGYFDRRRNNQEGIHLQEEFLRDDVILPEYWEWRAKGFSAEYPIRYPVGFKHKHEVKCSILENENGVERLDYVEARKRIYLPEYIRSVQDEPTILVPI